MAFGVYVHIPYCLQRCVYCDFATYQADQILPPSEYISRLKKEILVKAPSVGPRPLTTLYFGGGTPSLLSPYLLKEVISTLKNEGFSIDDKTEVTLEINPATLTAEKLDELRDIGFNRFSVGAQSFDEGLLKLAHRRHSPQDTRDTLSLLQSRGVNFSMDLLFALPTQTLGQLRKDLDEIAKWNPPHVSPYCLTVPEGHVFSQNRPPEGEQVEMFHIIEEALTSMGLHRYEISNFAKGGFESRHNLLYWQDEEYWGVGLSSHSYLHRYQWGCRFWNPRNINEYVSQIDQMKTWSLEDLDYSLEGERLNQSQALTDYFHTSLRMETGLENQRFASKFHRSPHNVAGPQLKKLEDKGLIFEKNTGWALTREGRLLSNKVFEELTFLPN